MKLSSFKSSVSGAWLLIGNPGTGKTTLCTQLPKPIIIELDNNIAGAANEVKRQQLSSDAEIVVPHIRDDGTIVERRDRYQALAKILDGALRNPEYQTIVVDSLTALTDYMFDEVRRQNGKKIGDTIGFSQSSKTLDENLSLPDWGAFMGLLKHFIITCKASGKLFVLTAHTMTDKDELAGFLKTYIACPTSMKETIAGYFDEVIRLQKVEEGTGAAKKTIIKLQTVPGNREESLGLKTSLGLLNNEPLDFKKLQAILSV